MNLWHAYNVKKEKITRDHYIKKEPKKNKLYSKKFNRKLLYSSQYKQNFFHVNVYAFLHVFNFV